MSNTLRTMRRGIGTWERGDSTDTTGVQRHRPEVTTTGTILDALRPHHPTPVETTHGKRPGLLARIRAFFAPKHARGV